jgi:DNA-directed RNA polymerase subunit RPC12/RpoP
VRADLKCSEPIEIPYYSSNAFEPICIHCGAEVAVNTQTSDSYPFCKDCRGKPQILKRKQKLFETARK